MWIQSLGQEDSLEEEMAIHPSVLAWRIPWTEEPGRLQSIELHRVWHDWSNLACMYIYIYIHSQYMFIWCFFRIISGSFSWHSITWLFFFFFFFTKSKYLLCILIYFYSSFLLWLKSGYLEMPIFSFIIMYIYLCLAVNYIYWTEFFTSNSVFFSSRHSI